MKKFNLPTNEQLQFEFEELLKHTSLTNQLVSFVINSMVNDLEEVAKDTIPRKMLFELLKKDIINEENGADEEFLKRLKKSALPIILEKWERQNEL